MIIDKELAHATPLMQALRLAYRMDETQAVTDLVNALDLPSDAFGQDFGAGTRSCKGSSEIACRARWH